MWRLYTPSAGELITLEAVYSKRQSDKTKKA